MCDCNKRYRNSHLESSALTRSAINGFDKHLRRYCKGRGLAHHPKGPPTSGSRDPPPRPQTYPELSEFPGEAPNVQSASEVAPGEVSMMLDNLQPKKPAMLNRMSSTSSNSSVNSSASAASAASSSVVTSSRRRSQVVHQSVSSSELTSSSSTSNLSRNPMSAQDIKSNLSELKSSMSEMKSSLASHLVSSAANNTKPAISSSASSTSSASQNANNAMAKLTSASAEFLRGSLEQLNITGDSGDMALAEVDEITAVPASVAVSGPMKFEQTRVASSSMTKITTGDGYSSEEAVANSSHSRRLQADGIHYEESGQAAAMKARVEMDGITAEKAAAVKQEQRLLKAGDVSQQESRSAAAASMKLSTDKFTAEKVAMATQQQKQTLTSAGRFNQERHSASTSQSTLTINAKSVRKETSVMASSQVNGMLTFDDTDSCSLPSLDDLDLLDGTSSPSEVQDAIKKYTSLMSSCMEKLKQMEKSSMPRFLENIIQMVRKAWSVPTHGYQLGYSLCDTLRTSGGLDILMDNCVAEDENLRLSSARLLEQCLTEENRTYVVDQGLEKVMQVAQGCNENTASLDQSRVATGLIEHLFQHNEGTCGTVVKLGGLDAVVKECRKQDVEVLRHCAGALVNLSLYGGAENQEAMINCKVPQWLFPLAFHPDDSVKYYACLAIAVLVANKEIEAVVLQSMTFTLVEPFVVHHNPCEFANTVAAHKRGHSKKWLENLVPVLSSKREEARNLAAFHFCMEAAIKKSQGLSHIFREIGVIEPLKMVASSPNATASKYAAQALRLVGEEVPHKLSQQVPLWSTEDVREWVKQIGFHDDAHSFAASKVDGDLLLQLDEAMLRDDIGIRNAILRKRFMRELALLKQKADYSSCDSSRLNTFLQSVDQTFCCYTYNLLMAGVDTRTLHYLTDDQLRVECGIENSIHRQRILDEVRAKSGVAENSDNKPLDAFISYRRSTGSQLASLLKVHLQLRNYSVFIDVERLEAGKFDNGLCQSIREARFFLLVLSPNALDRCIGDDDCKDWVHREILEALKSGCKIIPIFDNFQWPDAELLPEDIRGLSRFNGIRWVHDYQDACVDKLEKFMKSETQPAGQRQNQNAETSPLGTPGGNLQPNNRTAHYYRTLSTESKGSYSSEKEQQLNYINLNGITA